MVFEVVLPVSEAQLAPQVLSMKLYGPDGRIE